MRKPSELDQPALPADMDNSEYQADYGGWRAGGRPASPPDFTRCCASVTPNDRWGATMTHQCFNKRGQGPGLAYCAIHDPGRVAAKEAARRAKRISDDNRARYGWHGRQFFDALEQIANGHNDARGLAQQVITDFKAGEYK